MIKLSEKFRIVSDGQYNYELQELKDIVDKKTQEIKPTWSWVGYYSSIEGAIKSAVNKQLLKMVSSNEEQTLNDVLKEMRELTAKFNSIDIIQVKVKPNIKEVVDD